MARITLEQLRVLRKEAAHRRRRIIYNNDGGDLWRAKNGEEFLGRRTSGVENTQVDTISYCIAEPFMSLLYPRAMERGNPFNDLTHLGDGRWPQDMFLIEGRDRFEILMDFCRQHGIEIWASIRMNDTHDQWQIKSRTPFKSDHPERWLAKPPDLDGGSEEKMFLVSEGALEHPERWVPRGSCGVYYGVDYARPDVRDRMAEIAGDICRHYDVDGIELDFLRGPLFFRNTAKGAQDAGDENRALMTELIGRIRKITEEEGMQRGRPIVVAARVPDDPDLAGAYGLDVRTWLKEGLIDILIAGESARIRPWKEFVEFGHKYNVPVYACAVEIRGGDESIRGIALAAWAAGVDGIYTFNFVDPLSPLWKELGDPDLLVKRDRITPVYNANVTQIMDHLPRLSGARSFLSKPPRLPLELPHGRKQEFIFEAGEDGAKAAKSVTPHANVCLRFEFLEKEDSLKIRLNGQEPSLSSDEPAPGWVTCKDVARLLSWGENKLQITAKLAGKRNILCPRLIDLQVRVTARPQVYALKKEDVRTAPPMEGRLGAAFLLTATEILPPHQPLNAAQQWLLDELNFARPRVPGVYKFMREHYQYPEDPIEKPLPGWDSLAILFDTDKMPVLFEKELLFEFLKRVDSGKLSGETGVHAGPLAGSHLLAGVVVRSQSADVLEYIAACFGKDCKMEGLLPFPIRFLRAENDGHLIPRAFAIVFRGTLQAGVFRQDSGCWSENRLSGKDLAGTKWRHT